MNKMVFEKKIQILYTIPFLLTFSLNFASLPPRWRLIVPQPFLLEVTIFSFIYAISSSICFAMYKILSLDKKESTFFFWVKYFSDSAQDFWRQPCAFVLNENLSIVSKSFFSFSLITGSLYFFPFSFIRFYNYWMRKHLSFRCAKRCVFLDVSSNKIWRLLLTHVVVNF